MVPGSQSSSSVNQAVDGENLVVSRAKTVASLKRDIAVTSEKCSSLFIIEVLTLHVRGLAVSRGLHIIYLLHLQIRGFDSTYGRYCISNVTKAF